MKIVYKIEKTMNPKRIIHGNRKGIEIKRFDETTEEYWQFTPAADGTQTGIALNYKRNKKTAERTDEIGKYLSIV